MRVLVVGAGLVVTIYGWALAQDLPELAIIEGNQLVATKRDESFSPSLFTFLSYFVAIHHGLYYVFMTVDLTSRRQSPAEIQRA